MKSKPPTPEALPWSDSFSVGIAALDADHRDLVRRINEICRYAKAARRDQAAQTFEALYNEAAAHFKREEAVLRSLSGYRHLDAHAGEHRNRLKQLNELRRRYLIAAETAEVAQICDDLVHWFVRQSIGHDAEIRAFSDNRGSRFPLSDSARARL